MRPASLELAAKAAMRPETPSSAESPAPPEPELAATSPRPGWRRALAFLKRPAEFVRGFLLAPLHGRLNDVDRELRLAHERLRRLEARAEHIAGLTSQVSGLVAPTPQIAADTALVARSIGPRLDELEIKLRPLVTVDPQTTAIHLGDGWVLAPSANPAILTMLAGATSGGLEPGTRRALKRLIRPGMACADIGANLGLLTLAMARATGPEGQVWSFEPEPAPNGLLARTLALNGLSWVRLSATAAGAVAGKATFHVSPILGHSSLYALPDEEEAAAARLEVEVAPLDTLIPEATALDLIKIDVEGAELDVLSGMARLLAGSRDPALVVEYGPSHLARVGIEPAAWFAAFAAHGLKPYAIDEADGRASATRLEALGEVVSVNLAFVRPGGAAEARLLGRK